MSTASQTLAQFATALHYEQIPQAVDMRGLEA